VALDDFVEGEVGLAVLGTAAALSPRVRQIARRGAVYAVGGAMTVGDVVTGGARKVGGVVSGAAKGAVAGARDGGSSGRSAPGPSRRSTARKRNG
jgi:hypothetical protein